MSTGDVYPDSGKSFVAVSPSTESVEPTMETMPDVLADPYPLLRLSMWLAQRGLAAEAAALTAYHFTALASITAERDRLREAVREYGAAYASVETHVIGPDSSEAWKGKMDRLENISRVLRALATPPTYHAASAIADPTYRPALAKPLSPREAMKRPCAECGAASNWPCVAVDGHAIKGVHVKRQFPNGMYAAPITEDAP